MTAYSEVKPVRGMGIAILALLVIQLSLGITSYFVRVLHGHEVTAPTAGMVHVTVAHVAVGALLLAHCFILVVQSRRHLVDASPVRAREVVTA
jgi:hypothetical protein